MSDSVSALLAPRSIAVVGASRREGTMGRQIVHNLIAYGFTGAVFPVNPNASSVCAVRACPTIADVPDPVDVAMIVLPKERVLDVAEQCGAAGVKGLIVISAGFRETGREGAAREQQLVEIVRRHGMRMVGPNCMGIVNADPAVSMNATFATAMPPFGHAASVSQSGALGMSVLDHAREYRIGISQFVSVDNKPDVSGNDLLLAWETDPSVNVILMYVENFGNPTRFLEIARRITKTKPIIVVKSGRSRAGARGDLSHWSARGQRYGGGGVACTGRSDPGVDDRRVVRHGNGVRSALAAALASHGGADERWVRDARRLSSGDDRAAR